MIPGTVKTLAAAAAGAGAIYLLDPDRGRARRARLRDRSTSMLRREMRAVERRAHYQRGRLEGVRHRVTHPNGEQPPENDQVLVDKVRSEVLGRWPGSRRMVNVDACKGTVTLRGEVDDPALVAGLERDVAAVNGVESVVNLLHAPGEVAPNKVDARRVAAAAERRS